MLKEKARNTKIHGAFIKVLIDSGTIPLIQQSGMDFILYDAEHTAISNERLNELMQFANAIEMPTIVRVSELSKTHVSQTLDCGAQGIMVPMIETKEEAQQLVKYSKYPPIGGRGFAGGTHTNNLFGIAHSTVMQEKNHTIMTIAQIETREGVKNIEEIASVIGIDAIVIGPADLAISLGDPQNYDSEVFKEAMAKIIQTCKKFNIPLGMIAASDLIKQYEDDLAIIVSGFDINIIVEGFKKEREKY